MRFVLASNSPRRKELLSRAGFIFDTHAADIDETSHAGEAPNAFAVRMASEKANAVLKFYEHDAVIILAADTIVTIDGEILGKPTDASDALRMLTLLSGRTHEVITGWCILGTPLTLSSFETTRVTFRTLTDVEMRDYIATGEPFDKAGAYAIQGGAQRFSLRIDGLISNVIGLPVERLILPLQKAMVS